MKKKPRFNKGRWAVERERAYIDPWQRPSPDYRDRPIDDIVPQVMKGLGVESDYWESALIEEWVAIAGAHLARHTRPGRYERKVLTIFVTNSAYLSELSMFGKRDLLANLQKRFGKEKIRDIRLQIDPDRGA